MRLYQERQRDRFSSKRHCAWKTYKRICLNDKVSAEIQRPTKVEIFLNLSLPPSLTNRGSDWALVSRFLGSQRVLSFGPIPCSWAHSLLVRSPFFRNFYLICYCLLFGKVWIVIWELGYVLFCCSHVCKPLIPHLSTFLSYPLCFFFVILSCP